MNDQRLDVLQTKIKERVPSFDIKFKDKSLFMKCLGKLLFFNKGFMNDYITTIGTKVYWPSKEKFDQYPLGSFLTLAHEYVHIMDYKENPSKFILGYLFPQVLAIFSLFSVLAFISPWFLLFLLFLLTLSPLPAPFRKKAELRGYGMSLKVRNWLGWNINEDLYVDKFTSSAYYYMWPFKSIKKELKEWSSQDLNCLNDPNPAYRDVYEIIKS